MRRALLIFHPFRRHCAKRLTSAPTGFSISRDNKQDICNVFAEVLTMDEESIGDQRSRKSVLASRSND